MHARGCSHDRVPAYAADVHRRAAAVAEEADLPLDVARVILLFEGGSAKHIKKAKIKFSL